MAARNNGAGTRCMASAGRVFLNQAVTKGEMSFATAHSVDLCWKKFTVVAKAQGIRRTEHVTRDHLLQFGADLAVEVGHGELAAGYAQRLVSGVNTVLGLARADWAPVYPVGDCKIPRRVAVRKIAPTGMESNSVGAALTELRHLGLARAAAAVSLAWAMGLRSKESALLDARKAAVEAEQEKQVSVIAGTKGGRLRTVPTPHAYQREVLEEVAKLQGEDRSIIPADQNWQKFRDGELLSARAVLKLLGIRCYHDLRAAYACRRYEELTGTPAPVISGEIADKRLDREARLTISEELGHGRIEVTSAYVGGMS